MTLATVDCVTVEKQLEGTHAYCHTAYTHCSVLLRGKRLILRKFWCQKTKKKSPEIQENTNSHVWQHRTKITYGDKLFLLLVYEKEMQI